MRLNNYLQTYLQVANEIMYENCGMELNNMYVEMVQRKMILAHKHKVHGLWVTQRKALHESQPTQI